MTENPLFYRSIVPLDRQRHHTFRVRQTDRRFGFASGAHMIPVVVDEFPAGSRHLPIVFVPGPERPSPVFLVGFRPGQSLCVDADGHWTAGYIPAFLRRYPFILGEVPGRDPLACIDENFEEFAQAEGEALFDSSGAETATLKDRIKLMSDYFEAAKRTDASCTLMNDLKLFRQITVQGSGPNAVALHGLLAIDELRFNELSDEDFLRVRKANWLPAIYAHFLSLASVDRLHDRPPEAAPTPVAAPQTVQ